METIRILPVFALLLTVALTSACSDLNSNETIDEPDLMKIGEFTDNGVTVIAYTDRPLTVGFNDIWFEVHEDGAPIENPHFHFKTMMDMGHHSHASPYGEPEHHRDDEHNLYHGWAIFTMPSGDMGSWELQLTIHDQAHSGFEAAGIIEIDVEPSNRVKTFITEDESRYVLTLIGPKDPSVGMNELEVALHKRESMMNFPPVLNAKMEFEPWMPSMDHGSSNNVSPIHKENGFYIGQVNFNMTGDWELRFDLEIDGVEIDQQAFEIDF